VEGSFPALSQGEYALAVIPDPQCTVHSKPDVFEQSCKWIADNAEKYNILFTYAVGDMVGVCSIEDEWLCSARSIGHIASKMPAVIALGNHDYDDGHGLVRDTTVANRHFNYSFFAKMEGFAGAMEEGKMDNLYFINEFCGKKRMSLVLDFGAPDPVLEWANKVVSAHPECDVILLTHSLQRLDGGFLDEGYGANCKRYIATLNDGSDIWNKFIKRHKNISTVICGHTPSEDIVCRRMYGDNGNEVKMFLVDCQYIDELTGGTGNVALFFFKKDGIHLRFYSPVKDKFYKQVNQFVIENEL